MNNVSMIGTVSGVPRAERDGARRWAVLSLLVHDGEGAFDRFEVVAEGRAVEVVLGRDDLDGHLAVAGRLGRGRSGGVVVIAEHAVWLSASQVTDLAAAVRPSGVRASG